LVFGFPPSPKVRVPSRRTRPYFCFSVFWVAFTGVVILLGHGWTSGATSSLFPHRELICSGRQPLKSRTLAVTRFFSLILEEKFDSGWARVPIHFPRNCQFRRRRLCLPVAGSGRQPLSICRVASQTGFCNLGTSWLHKGLGSSPVPKWALRLAPRISPFPFSRTRSSVVPVGGADLSCCGGGNVFIFSFLPAQPGSDSESRRASHVLWIRTRCTPPPSPSICALFPEARPSVWPSHFDRHPSTPTFRRNLALPTDSWGLISRQVPRLRQLIGVFFLFSRR